jgi:hypothetical protein
MQCNAQCNASLIDIVVRKCPTECDKCTAIYINEVLNSKLYCRCNCHKKKAQALEQVVEPDANAFDHQTQTSPSQELIKENDD